MPKDPWKYKPKKRRSRGKLQENLFERPQLSAPTEPSITVIETLDNMPSIKSEEEQFPVYPDTRFPQSTTLFPASEIENNSRLPGNFGESFKRFAKDDLFKIPKKMKLTDSTMVKETLSEDCMVIENSSDKVKVAISTKTSEESFCDDCMIIDESPKKVEVEVVDLTDESGPSVQMACTPVKISFPKRRKPNLTLKANDDAHVKVESNEKPSDVYTNPNTKRAMQQKSKENKASRPTDTTTHNIFLTSELDIVKNGGVNPQVRVTNTVSVSVLNNATEARISDSHFVNDIPLIMDQNWEVSDNSEPVSKFTSDVNHAGIKAKRKYDVGDNYLSAPTPSLIYRTQVPTIVPLVVDNLSQSAIKTTTKERVKDWLAGCSVNGGKALENLVFDKEKKAATDSNHSALLTVAQVKEELKDADCQEISFNSDETQLNEDLLQKNTSTGLVSSETLTSNELNQGSLFLTNHNGVFPVVLQVNEQKELCKKFLKYLNVNKKVELHEISNAILYLNNMIMGKEVAVGGNRLSEQNETSKNLLMEKETSNNMPIKKEISNILPTEKNENNILELFSSDVLRQILITTNTAKPI